MRLIILAGSQRRAMARRNPNKGQKSESVTEVTKSRVFRENPIYKK
jgi:hypothetical protein